jgi:hypothetical protein
VPKLSLSKALSEDFTNRRFRMERVVATRNKLVESEFLSPQRGVHCSACGVEFESGDRIFLLREYIKGEKWWDSWVLLATFCWSCGCLRRDL